MLEDALTLLRNKYGSYTALAKLLGVTPQAINGWRVTGDIPPRAAVEIERLTDGEFKAVDLVKAK